MFNLIILFAFQMFAQWEKRIFKIKFRNNRNNRLKTTLPFKDGWSVTLNAITSLFINQRTITNKWIGYVCFDKKTESGSCWGMQFPTFNLSLQVHVLPCKSFNVKRLLAWLHIKHQISIIIVYFNSLCFLDVPCMSSPSIIW